jgi:SAM-dependent methyltransferase
VNGSVRPFFHFAREYTRIDLVLGPSVDIVAPGHEFGTSNSYDIVLSCEAFEHNPLWIETFINMIRVCRPSGAVLFTCATTGRLEHGTARTSTADSPGTSALGWNYYRSIAPGEFRCRLDLALHLADWEVFHVRSSRDLYFVGVKRSAPRLRQPEPHNVVSQHRDELRRVGSRLAAA